jgi:SRSO17 transposase
MFKIVRFPSRLESFFSSLTKEFHWDHFEYFRILVLLIAFSWERRNIASLYRYLDSAVSRHRTRFNNFLNLNRWDPASALAEKAQKLLSQLKPRKGDTLYFILDDSKKGKRGKFMEAVGKIFDPVTQTFTYGHQYVKATICFRGYTIPFGIRLYVKQQDCDKLDVDFQKTTQFAAQLIREFKAPKGCKVKVLFDCYYLCPSVVKACREKDFRFVSTLKSNRNLFKNGRKLKAGIYAKNLFRRIKKTSFSVRKHGRSTTYTYVNAGWLSVSDLGELHVVFSRKNKDRNVLGIVTDDPKLSAAQIIKTYEQRWSIEVFFKDVKQLLGLGQYQNRSYTAAVIHLHLVCFAYALLTHIAISKGAKGKQKSADDMSTADLQNELRRIVWEDTADYLKELPNGNSVVEELSRLLVA